MSYADNDRMTNDEPEEVETVDINTMEGGEHELSSLDLIKQLSSR